MSFKIDSIRVRNFRGVRRINLPVEGCNLIIVGENGSGKSSIVDALEYYFTGRVTQLEGRSDVNKRRCIPNLKGGPTEVELAFKGVAPASGICIGYPERCTAIPKSLQRFFDVAARQTFVLRRCQVLQFINSRDSQRYQQMSQLIGLEALDTIDKTWRKEWRASQERVEELRTDRQGIYNRLSELCNQPVKTRAELVRAVNARLFTQQPG